MNEFRSIGPRNHMVVIKPYESATETKSGMMKVNQSNTASGKSRGIILEVASDCSPDLKVGQTVLFRRYSHDEVKYVSPEGEVSIFLVMDEEILAVPELS